MLAGDLRPVSEARGRVDQMSTNQDRETALVALRAEMITGAQCELAMATWMADQSVSMGEILESRGFIDTPTRARLESLVAQEQAEATDPPVASRAGNSGWLRGSTGRPRTARSVDVDPGATPPTPSKPHDEFATLAPDSQKSTVEASPETHRRVVSLEDLGAGDARNRYSRTHLHAKGGIGQVWLAVDGELGREIALKELRPEQEGGPVAWARFVNEARITGQLDHPGIVPIYELSVNSEGGPFYTMRFVRGKTLDRSIRDYHDKRKSGQADQLDLASLLTAYVSLCNTVGFAHSRGVIHRDLKGQNVVLGDYGEVILLDWGIAKLIGSPDPGGGERSDLGRKISPNDAGLAYDATLQGQVIGTPSYMAPEQAEGRIEDIDARTDVYGLGAILYEILSGKTPYQGDTIGETLRKVIEGPPVAPRLVNPGVPRGLEAICRRAMSQRSVDRYPTALLLAEDVRKWLADEPISAYRESWTTRLARAAKRHRTAVSAAAVLLMTAVVALGIASVLVGRERDEARRQGRQARQAVDENYTKVAEEWLADRLDPLQRQFLMKALAYYRDFAGPDDGDPTLRQDRGRANLRLGDVLRKLGRHDESRAAYAESIAILDRLATDEPADPAHRDYLAEATYRLGTERAILGQTADHDAAMRLFQQAVSLQEALLTQSSTTARKVALGRTLGAMAEQSRIMSRADDSEAAYRRAVSLLEQAATDDPVSIPPQQELGVVLDGLGMLLKDRGRREEALKSTHQAVDVFEKLVAEAPTQPNPREGLAKVYNTLGLLLREEGTSAESEAVLTKEVALNRRLADDYPTRPEYRRTLARSLINLGILYQETRRTREADTAYTEALKLNEKLAAEAPEVRRYARDQARCLNNLAELKAARAGESEPLFRQALKINQTLVAAAPGIAEHKIAEAGVLQNLGNWLAARDRRAEGIEMLRQSVTCFETLAAADPTNPAIRRGLSRCLNVLGATLLADGQRAEAEDAFRRAVNAFDQLVALPPVLRADQISLATCLSNRGSNQTAAKLAGAEDSLRRSLGLFDSLMKEGPRSPDLRLQLAAARNNLGDWLTSDGQPEPAEVAYRDSLGVLSTLATEFPQVPIYTTILGQVQGNLGEFLIAHHRPDEARPLLEQGIRAERQAVGGDARDSLHKHMIALAGLYADRKAYGDVVNICQDLLKVAESLPSVQPEVARLLARCVTLVRTDDTLSGDRKAILSGDYADRAVALLREVIERDGSQASRLLSEPAFDPIRDRDGFKTLEPAKVGRSGDGQPEHPLESVAVARP